MLSPNNANSPVIDNLAREFAFPIQAYDALVEQFIHELREGLTQEEAMPMIPTFVYHLPTGQEKAVLLSLDLGGTNLRVCRTTLSGAGEFEITHKKWTISDSLKKGPGKELFAWIAERIEEFVSELCSADDQVDHYPLGMTFSFPCEQLDINVGKLINWTKGFRGLDVIGKDVVKILQDCIDARNIKVVVNSLINDTVGTLLATAYKHPGCEIGIIFGTGTNCAYLEDQQEIHKIKPEAANYKSPTNQQVINTEWGAFGNKSGALPVNSYDRLLDNRSSQPGKQLYEKMVSGLYVSELTRLVLCDLASKGDLFVDVAGQPPKTAEQLGDLAIKERFDGAMMGALEGDDSSNLDGIERHFKTSYNLSTSLNDRHIIKYICEVISARAARLSAVGIAALIKKRNLLSQTNQVIVGIDGSLFNKYPNFRQHLVGALNEIFDAATVAAKVSLIHAEDGSGSRIKADSFTANHSDIKDFVGMADSTPQPDDFLNLDLVEINMEPQTSTEGESFIDFTGPHMQEQSNDGDLAGENNNDQGAVQWREENNPKIALGEAVILPETSVLTNTTQANFENMMGTQVALVAADTPHWRDEQPAVFGSLMEMELKQAEQGSGFITPNLIFNAPTVPPSESAVEAPKAEEDLSGAATATTAQEIASETALLTDATTTTTTASEQTSPQSITPSQSTKSPTAAKTETADVKPPPAVREIRRSGRTRRQSSMAALSEEYLQVTQGGLVLTAPVPERVTRSKKVYCHCQKPDNGEVMIQCDDCRQWFHGACVDITDEIAELMGLKNEKFFCDPCAEKLKDANGNDKVLYRSRTSDNRDCALPTCLNEARLTSDYCSEECAIKGIELEASQSVSKPGRVLLPIVIPSRSVPPPAASPSTLSPAIKKSSAAIPPKSPVSPKPEQDPIRSTALKGLTESLRMAADSKEKETKDQTKGPDDKEPKKEETGSGQSMEGVESKKEETGSSQSMEGVEPKKEETGSSQSMEGVEPKEEETGDSQSTEGVEPKKEETGSSQSMEGVEPKEEETGDSQPMESIEPKKSDNEERPERPSEGETPEKAIKENSEEANKDEEPRESEEKIEPKGLSEEQIVSLATEIERELYLYTATPGQIGCGRDYKTKYRSLFFNLKDKNNSGLREKILSGVLTPFALVRLSPEELANPELQSMAEEVRKRSIHDSVLTIEQGSFIKTTHRGDLTFVHGPSLSSETVSSTTGGRLSEHGAGNEQEAGSPSTSDDKEAIATTPTDGPKTSANGSGNNSSKTTPVGSPTTNALDKLLARIQTNKRSGEEVLSEVLAHEKRQKLVEGDTDFTLSRGGAPSSYLPREPSPYSPSPSPPDSPAVASTTPPDSPPPFMLEDIKRNLERKNRSIFPVWQGTLQMHQVARFPARAFQVGGRAISGHSTSRGPLAEMVAPAWTDLLTKGISIDGRISTSSVESYVAQQLHSATKEVLIVQFEIADRQADEESDKSFDQRESEFTKLFRYFHEKKRNGVVPQKGRDVKDVYLVPVGANDPLPNYFKGLVDSEDKIRGPEPKDALFAVLVVNKPSTQRSHHVHSPMHSRSHPAPLHRSSGSTVSRPYPTQQERRGSYSPRMMSPREDATSAPPPQPPQPRPVPFAIGAPMMQHHHQSHHMAPQGPPPPPPGMPPTMPQGSTAAGPATTPAKGAKAPSLQELQSLVNQLFPAGTGSHSPQPM
ncbi:glucokinase, partial [Lunasporangiospora selenospora]